MIDIYSLSTILPVLFALFLIGYIVGGHQTSPLHRAFVYFFTTASIGAFLAFLVALPLSVAAAHWISYLNFFCFLPLGVLYANFLYIAIGRRRDTPFLVMIILLILALPVAAFLPVVSTIQLPGYHGFLLVPTTLGSMLLLIVDFIPGFYTLVVCGLGMSHIADQQRRKQLAIIIIGGIVSTAVGLSMAIVLPVFMAQHDAIRLCSLAMLFQIFAAYWAVLKHRFLTIETKHIEEVSRLLFDNVNEGVAILDEHGVLIQCNKAIAQLEVFPAAQNSHIKLGDVFSGVDLGGTFEGQRVEVVSNGQNRIFLASLYPIMREEKRFGKILILHDLTNQTKMEAELTRSRHLESLGVLAGGIAHDFNNFLTSISGSFSILKMSRALEEVDTEVIHDAQEAVHNAARLTQQLMTFAKGGTPIKEVLPIKNLVEEAVRFCLRGTNCNFILQCPDDIGCVHADRQQLNQVMHNLALNAMQAMPQGGTIEISLTGVTIPTDTTVQSLAAGAYIKITVADHGEGIDRKHIARVFEPYFTTKKSGTGLGLATVYSIIKRHDGLVTINSEQGTGTQIDLYLPLAEGKPAVVAPTESLIRGSGTILIMDDQPIVLMSLERMLKSLGYTVEKALDGAKALELFRQDNRGPGYYKAVIVDLTVPGGMGGLELQRNLHRREPGLKIIVTSGYSDDPVMAQFTDYGFCGVLKKPYDLDILSTVVAQAIYPVATAATV